MAAFSGKVIVVTGASEGIGRALCLALAPQGPKLVLSARNEERLASAAKECEALGAETLVVLADVTDPEACGNLMARTVEHFGGLDVLVNNAGGTMWALFEEVEDLSIFERLMRQNYLSSVYCTHHALPHLKSSKGMIVAVASLAGLNGVPTRTGYAASKHAMFGFFESLRIEVEDAEVDVVMIAPDFVVTEIHKRALKGDGTPLEKTPLQEGKVMSAADCAAIMVDGMERRKRLVITSLRGKVGRWLKVIAPRAMDGVAKRAIASGK